MSEKYFLLEVGGLPDDLTISTKSRLELYFSNKRRSGGDECEVKEHPNKKRKVLIYYKTQEARERVLRKTHDLEFKEYGTVRLQVQPFEDESGEMVADTPIKNISQCNITPVKLEKNILLESPQKPHSSRPAHDEEPDSEMTSSENMEVKEKTVLLKSDSFLPTEFIELYFESFSENIQIQKKEENIWVLACLNKDDLKKILCRTDHQVNGVPLHIELEDSTEFDKRRFILEGFKESTRLPIIDLYIDSCSNNTAHSLEVLDDGKQVVVTFKSDIDAGAFMKNCSGKKLDEAPITVSRLEPTDTVMVEGKFEELSEDLLKLYFSNSKRSNGGDISSFTINRLEGVAMIQFKDPSVIETVTTRHHVISDIQLKVSPYFQSLQKPLYGDKHPSCEIPKMVEIPVEPAIKEYLKCNDLFKHKFEKVCKATYSDLEVSTTVNQITLKRSIDESKILFYKVARQWEQNAKETVHSFLNGYDTEDIAVDAELWERIRKQCEALEHSDLGLWYNQSKNILTAVGEQQLVANAMTNINHIIKEAEIALEIEKNTTEETISFDTHKAADFVLMVVQDSLCDVELQRNSDCTPCQIKITGVNHKVAQAKNCIAVAKNKMVTQNVDLSSDMVKFITSLSLTAFVSDYFTSNGIKATLFSENSLKLIAAHADEAKKAIDKIKQAIKEENICLSAEQAKVTESIKWKSFIERLQGEIKSWNEKCDISSDEKKITVVGPTSVAADVTNKIKGYLDNKKTSSKVLDLKDFHVLDYVEKFINPSLLPDFKDKDISILPRKMMPTPNITINGAAEYIDDALMAVQKYVETIVSKTFVYSNPGEAKVLEKQKDAVRSKAVESGCMVWFTQQSAIQKPPLDVNFHTCLNGLNLFAKHGDILKEKADALVCPIDGDMSFSMKLIKDVIHAGGPEIQKECGKIIRERKTLACGDVLTPCKGMLHFQLLILAVTPIWGKCNYTMKGKNMESIYLKHVFLRCFDTAEQKQCTSIALPILGSNDFGFSIHESAVTFMEAVKEYVNKKQSQTIKEIYVIDMDEKAIEEFSEAANLVQHSKVTKKQPKYSLLQKFYLKHCASPKAAAASFSTEPTLEVLGVTVTLKKGDITQEDVNAIVNSTNKTLDLDTGVSGAILKAAGSSVKDECKTLDNEVVITGSGNLKCKFIVHMVGPTNAAGMIKSAEKVLQECEKKGIKTISFPAVGTGRGGMGPRVAIESILKGFENYFQNTSQTVITSISIIAFEQKIYDAFHDYFKERQQQPATTKQGTGLQTPSLQGIQLSSSKQGNPAVQSMSSPDQIKLYDVEVTVKKGDITKEVVKAIVNTTNTTLSLQTGVSGAILKEGGSVLVDECKKHSPLPAEGVVMTSAGTGTLSCDHVIHMVGPTKLPGVTSQVEKVLQECEKNQIDTISFPAIGTGAGCLIPKEVVPAMLQAFLNHLSKQSSTVLKSIFISVFEDRVYNEFIDGLKEWGQAQTTAQPSAILQSSSLPSASTSVSNPHLPIHQSGSVPDVQSQSSPEQIKISNVTVTIRPGDITKECVKAIVNSTNKTLDLKSGVSGAIFTQAGKSVEDECRAFGSLPDDGVAVTGGGSLSCDYIIHMVGPTTLAGVTSQTEKVLQECEKNQITTVSFPAVGTGVGKLSPEDVIKAMLQGFSNHLSKQGSSAIRFISIILFESKLFNVFIKGLTQWADSQKSKSNCATEDSDSCTDDDMSDDDTNDKQLGCIEIKVGKIKVQTICADITNEETNAIVNSNNNELNLKTGVSGAVLKAAGQPVEDECKALGNQTGSGFVRTTAGKLKVKHIMHTFGLTSVKVIKKIMLKILNECQDLNLNSVSFPALGTGSKQYSPKEVAQAMMDAIDNFVKDCSNPSVKLIRVVIFNKKMLQDFQDVMEKAKTVSPKSKQNVHQQGRITLAQSGNQSPLELLKSVQYPSCTVQIYSTSKDAISKVHSYIDDIIKDNCSTQLINTTYGNSFSDVELQTICAMCEKTQIKVELETDSIVVKGKTDDVLASVVKINSLLQDLKERINRKQEEDIIKKTVQWEIVTEENIKPFNSNLNYELEMNFLKKQNIFTYTHGGQLYTINFEKKEQADPQGNCVKIRRRILLEDHQLALVQPPPAWTDMGSKDFDVVLLQVDSPEFKKVSENFKKTCIHFINKYKQNVIIVTIERIQNLKLWQSYSIRKQTVDRKYPKSQNENTLYHGTTYEISQKINKRGFNRSYCGRNATHYGLGTYFAKEAYYSCDQQYSYPDQCGNKRIYQARVITGKLCQGGKDLKEPSPVNPLDPLSDLCDCAVDRLNNPFVYVIFCDDGAYPEYLITFKTVPF
ncbi:protein mono-ADP-ribosyltransferase PARP14-like [Protopterus annectens]|uniref:protein mono-ADP-ribosyltransferase PARP14-like n=1 Tax=Protopterus annectens TaxID=7888 RepID=UPI001CF983E1|nr:protein mono-ADP-ribosyltransferase PARP14-like [Protopterus annectens]